MSARHEAPLLVLMGRRAHAVSNGPPRPALFLDRDGVIMEDTGYPDHPEVVRLMPGAADGIAAAIRSDAIVVVVSNQSGVGRGYFGWSSVIDVDRAMAAALQRVNPGAEIDLTLYAGAAPRGDAATDPYRKPAPGMLQTALRLLPIDISASVLVGDRMGDIAAAEAAGVRSRILVGGPVSGAAMPHIPARNTAEAFDLALASLNRRMAAT